jgi:molybdopterin molybdotransferase
VTFESAARLITSTVRRRLRPSGEVVRLEAALGRAAAKDIRARMPSPPFDNSAMDGYAVRSRDVRRAVARLKVVEVIPAGRTPSEKIGRCECARIMTGSRAPAGADAVVMRENASAEAGGFVTILRSVRRGENLRFAGEDVKKGALLIPKGSLLGPAELGLAASQGLKSAAVLRRPVVGFFTTGDEVVMPGRRLKSSLIYNANRYTLGAAIAESGCSPLYAGHLSDDERSAASAISSAVARCDALITCGGVSMGDFDIVKKSLRRLGAKFIFERIEMKPGRPTGFALLRGKPVFTLPGNVVSSLLSYELLVSPHLSPHGSGFGRVSRAVSGFTYSKNDSRRHFLRVNVESDDSLVPSARLTGAQGSGILSSMSGYDALAVILEGRVSIRRGSIIKIISRRPKLSRTVTTRGSRR